MILKVDRQQRNYNFLEIVKCYNAALNKNRKKGYIDSIYDLNLELVGIEYADKIYDALTPEPDNADNNKTSLDLFYKENGKYYFSYEKPILPVSTVEEAGVIYSMLKKGDFDLFLDKNEKKLLEENIKLFFSNIGSEPTDLYSYIDTKGKAISADNLGNIKSVFSVLEKAIEGKKQVKIEYKASTCDTFDIQPIKFVFSQLDKKMKIKAFSSDGKINLYYLDCINKIEILDRPSFITSSFVEPKIKKLKFTFENDYNLPERIAARFSDYQKEIHFNRADNTLTYIVDYEDTPNENKKIISYLCSLGKRVDVLSDEKEIIKVEAKKALANYKMK